MRRGLTRVSGEMRRRGGRGSEVAKEKDRARDKETCVRGKQTEDRDAYMRCTEHKGA